MFQLRIPKSFGLAAVTLLVFGLLAATPAAAAPDGLTDFGARVTGWIHTILGPWMGTPDDSTPESANSAIGESTSTPQEPNPSAASCQQSCEDGGGAIGDPDG